MCLPTTKWHTDTTIRFCGLHHSVPSDQVKSALALVQPWMHTTQGAVVLGGGGLGCRLFGVESSFASDMWSMGVIAGELCGAGPPLSMLLPLLRKHWPSGIAALHRSQPQPIPSCCPSESYAVLHNAYAWLHDA